MKAKIIVTQEHYLNLLKQAGIQRFEQLRHQEPASLLQRVVEINNELNWFPKTTVKQAGKGLLEKAEAGKSGIINLIALAGLAGIEDFPRKRKKKKDSHKNPES